MRKGRHTPRDSHDLPVTVTFTSLFPGPEQLFAVTVNNDEETTKKTNRLPWLRVFFSVLCVLELPVLPVIIILDIKYDQRIFLPFSYRYIYIRTKQQETLIARNSLHYVKVLTVSHNPGRQKLVVKCSHGPFRRNFDINFTVTLTAVTLTPLTLYPTTTVSTLLTGYFKHSSCAEMLVS